MLRPAPLVLSLLAGCQFTVDRLTPDGAANGDLASADLAMSAVPDLAGADLAGLDFAVTGSPDLTATPPDLTTTPPDLTATPPDLAATPPDLTMTGTLTGKEQNAPSFVSLTMEGTTDWIHWGLNGVSANRKMGSTALSDYSMVAGTAAQGLGFGTWFSWTDGTPTMFMGGTQNAVQVSGVGNGFTFTCAADPNANAVLRIYVGAFNSTGQLVAHLNDNSAADFTSSALVSSGNNAQFAFFQLSFRPASTTKLTLTWTDSANNKGNGLVWLAAATLQ